MKHHPGTKHKPISITARLFAIAQLCLTFTIFLTIVSSPFLQRMYQSKSMLLLIDYVKEQTPFSLAQEDSRRYSEAKHFYLDQLNTSFIDRLFTSWQNLFHETSPLLLLWLILGIVIPVYVLKQKEGIENALWLLPLIVACYAYQEKLSPQMISSANALFPTEEQLVAQFAEEPLKRGIWEQKAQLEEVWNAYLLDRIGLQKRLFKQDTPAHVIAQIQALQYAEWNFQKERLDILLKNPIRDYRASLPILALFIGWSFLAAAIWSRSLHIANTPILTCTVE